MKFSKDIVVGLKFYVGPIDIEGIDTVDFVDTIQFGFSLDDVEGIKDSTGIYQGENTLTCKYFDDEEGIMYVIFDQEVEPEDLPFFGEDEFIYKKVEE